MKANPFPQTLGEEQGVRSSLFIIIPSLPTGTLEESPSLVLNLVFLACTRDIGKTVCADLPG